ncbi:transcription factor jumonji [Heterostelium album PN500]|uniref:Pulmonary surfactant-associated protein B n=1 Tax=Heterostelium pallidum (strain ATCC 26659 / Pp 5 / PN500) TaxID=670386 RepID=D3BDG3_HETP5|nr:transcription factor jumonji [Heterostelium album PN500]EFA80607.1 transcription factor jumonji [Heterostelium album PN500]|eukprot:XP_020432727.1 transcription factor jumonji [Heterostelium album PN500]
MKLLLTFVVIFAIFATAQANAELKCDLCQFVVNHAEQLVLKNHTQTQIIHQMEKSCHKLPHKWSGQCVSLIDGYGPLIIQKLVEREDPKTVCNQIHLCKKHHVSIEEEVEETVDDEVPFGKVEKHHFPIGHHHFGKKLECKACDFLVKKAEHYYHLNQRVDEIESALDHECNYFEIKPAVHICKKVVHKATAHIIAEFKKSTSPGVVGTWPCFNLWKSPSYLIGKIGDTEIPIREIGYDVGEWLGKTTNLKFSTFFENWLNNCNSEQQQQQQQQQLDEKQQQQQQQQPKYYLASLPVHKYFKELMNDYEVPDIPKEQGKSANLWIGSKGQVTPLHHDWSTGDPGMDGLHAIVSGRKLFRLFDPAANIKFIKRKNEWGLFHHATIDLDHPDYLANPEFQHAESLDVVLEQGVEADLFANEITSKVKEWIDLKFKQQQQQQQHQQQ